MTELRIAVIVGSTRERRFAKTVADWFVGRARLQEGVKIDVIDLEVAGLPAILNFDNDAATEAYVQRIAGADAFVMITPEYNHSYPASLKQAIDVAQEEWHAKPVAFLSYGGMGGGIRAVEHLRAVMPEVHATTIRNTISLHNVWGLFDDEGNFREPERYNKSVDAMFHQLIWWARALSEAKAKTPYAA
ncbi:MULTISPECIES: NADPH-dependent FMN reductase [Roseobacteraceae]|uniref:FMN-dependent NADPH-azoreductase n=1 Tax=Pseudosulfitobacter pseudonitzschiae TaxID=1402135 RepID=A0A221JX60_9RHOB|nr:MULTISPECIES: NAD(P)H-dependent oxidoreductase [Roseobacteraceae]ASM71306.1 FMN-dependent NADPH-azoreductase [Pseudosulfitobacter pseudonitzschiae]